MLNSVSFGSSAGVFDKPDFSKPQSFQRPGTVIPGPNPPVPPNEKKGGIGKTIAKIAVAIGVTAALLAAGNKYNVFKNVGKHLPDAIKNASWLQWAKSPVKTALNGLDSAGKFLVDHSVSLIDTVKNSSIGKKVAGWFGKAPATPAPAPVPPTV